MDMLRGTFSGQDLPGGDDFDYDDADDETGRELPPSSIGTDERRMQVRAYNFWASLLLDRSFPSIEELDPEALPDFGPFSVLLDFTSGIEDPAVIYLGNKLAGECGTQGPISKLSDVPSRSLLSRITDHYLQIIANQAPIGFEAEFVNQHGTTVMYRGILLPFSSDDDTIDFIYGVINWKELADQQTTDALMAEIDHALHLAPELAPALAHDAVSEPVAQFGFTDESLPEWSAPLAQAAYSDEEDEEDEDGDDGILDLALPIDGLSELEEPQPEREIDAPLELSALEVSEAPSESANSSSEIPLELLEQFAELTAEADPFDLFGALPPELAQETPVELMDWVELESGGTIASVVDADLSNGSASGLIIEPSEQNPETMVLADWLASARELARAAQGSEDRSRQTLYAAIGRAFDFSLAAAAEPESFAELIADSGLTVQDRAPMTPVVKLVFGADYDKTRLAEYASAIGHAHRLGLQRGTLADYLVAAPGGLKAVVGDERKLRREELGAPSMPRQSPAERLCARLRELGHQPLDTVAADGSEFTLLIARRLPTGEVVLLGEVGGDVPLLERAARHLLA